MEQQYYNREFMIFPLWEINKIDFSQVLETSPDTVRKSTDGVKTFVKWDGSNIPSSVQTLQFPEGPYTYDEILTILSTPEWTGPAQP